MRIFKRKKVIYLIVLGIITLLAFVVSPTYAKFVETYVTDEDVVEMDLSFDVSITGIDEYHEIEVIAGESLRFNVQIDNDSTETAYYGVWYKMVNPSSINENISIGRLEGTSVSTSGEVESNGSEVVTIGIINRSLENIKLYVGVASSPSGVGDIEYLNGKQLITNTIKIVEANAPNLYGSNLVPVYYDEVEEVWKKADSNNIDDSWYDYDKKKWANAVLVNDISVYDTVSVGSVINQEDIVAFMVWVPRFKYRVWNINRQVGDESTYAYDAITNGIEIEWEIGTNSTGNVLCTYDITNVMSETTLSDACVYNDELITTTSINADYSDAWYTHPAFSFGGLEKTGFWIGKFETATIDGSTPYVLPDLPSFVNLSVSEQFTIAKSFQSLVSDNVDAHMLTNLEWGAVTYLTHSIYGLCDENSCRDVYINNSEKMYTGRSAGVLAASSAVDTYGTYDYKGYLIDNSTGVVTATKDVSLIASTTGNITGVYDMVGGAYEYVMANMVDVNNTFNSLFAGENWNGDTTPNIFFYNAYSYGETVNNQVAFNRAMLGDATAELIKNIDSDSVNDLNLETKVIESKLRFVNSDLPWFVRGSNYEDVDSELSSFQADDGNADAYNSFRLSIS